MPRTALLDRLAAEGSLGKKAGRGFYIYEHGKRRGVANGTRVSKRLHVNAPVPPPGYQSTVCATASAAWRISGRNSLACSTRIREDGA